MPVPSIVPILVGTVLVGGGIGTAVYFEKQAEEKRKAKKKKRKKAKDKRKTPTFAENATLGNSPALIQQIVLPIELGELGPVRLRMPDTDNVIEYGTLSIWQTKVRGDGKELPLTPAQALSHLVTDMGPAMTQKAWAVLQDKIANQVLFDVPSLATDNAIKSVLSTVDPNTDWSRGLSPYTSTSVQARLWDGVRVLGELIHQSVYNQQAIDEGGGGGGAPVPTPGGESTADVDKQWANFFSKGDLVGPTKVVHREDFGTPLEPFFGQIKIFEDDQTRSEGIYTGVAVYDTAGDDGIIILYDGNAPALAQKLRDVLELKRASR